MNLLITIYIPIMIILILCAIFCLCEPCIEKCCYKNNKNNKNNRNNRKVVPITA